MDDTNAGIDLNLDPDMITTQATPTPIANIPASPTASTPLVQSSVIDITPGKSGELPTTPAVSHIDAAATPIPAVEDITPTDNSAPSVSPVIEDITPPVATAPVSSISPVNPVSSPVLSTPALDSAPVSATPAVLPAPVIETAPVEPTAPVVASAPVAEVSPTTPVAPVTSVPSVSPAQPADGVSGLKIDTSSPLYEDPDTVVLAK